MGLFYAIHPMLPGEAADREAAVLVADDRTRVYAGAVEAEVVRVVTKVRSRRPIVAVDPTTARRRAKIIAGVNEVVGEGAPALRSSGVGVLSCASTAKSRVKVGEAAAGFTTMGASTVVAVRQVPAGGTEVAVNHSESVDVISTVASCSGIPVVIVAI